jgi:hypothetical protein
VTKDTAWFVQLHSSIVDEVQQLMPDSNLSGMVMDHTSTNRSAMTLLLEEYPTKVFIGCIAHGRTLPLKHCFKRFDSVCRGHTYCSGYTAVATPTLG